MTTLIEVLLLKDANVRDRRVRVELEGTAARAWIRGRGGDEATTRFPLIVLFASASVLWPTTSPTDAAVGSPSGAFAEATLSLIVVFAITAEPPSPTWIPAPSTSRSVGASLLLE